MGWTEVRTDVLTHKVGKCPACKGYLWADTTAALAAVGDLLGVEVGR